jgi:hypothetical protein
VKVGDASRAFSQTIRFRPSKLNVAAAGALQAGRAHSLDMVRTYRGVAARRGMVTPSAAWRVPVYGRAVDDSSVHARGIRGVT